MLCALLNGTEDNRDENNKTKENTLRYSTKQRTT